MKYNWEFKLECLLLVYVFECSKNHLKHIYARYYSKINDHLIRFIQLFWQKQKEPLLLNCISGSYINCVY